MTDEEVFYNKLEIWHNLSTYNTTIAVMDNWNVFISTLDTTIMIKFLRYMKSLNNHNDSPYLKVISNIMKTRDIPEEMKLEVLLLLGD